MAPRARTAVSVAAAGTAAAATVSRTGPPVEVGAGVDAYAVGASGPTGRRGGAVRGGRPAGGHAVLQPLPGGLRDPPFVGEGEVVVHLLQREPRDVDGLAVGVVVDGQLAAEGLEEVVVHELVHATVGGGEPVVDGPELGEHPSGDPGLLSDLALRGLGERLARLNVALRQAPLDAAGPVAAGDHAVRAPSWTSMTTPPAGAPRPRAAGVRAERRCTSWVLRSSRSPVHSNQRRNLPVCVRLRWRSVPPSELPDLLRAAVARLAPVIPVGQELGRRFAAAGHELALVGGAVRDAFLGRTSPDLDFTTDATPDETLEVIRGWADAHWEIGKAFGTIGLRKGRISSR